MIRVGELVREDKQPALGRVTARCTFKINRLEDRTFLLQTPPPPFHVDVRIDPTFVPREIDPRDSGHARARRAGRVQLLAGGDVPLDRRGCAAGLRGPGR